MCRERKPLSSALRGDLGNLLNLAASLQERDERLDSLKTLAGALAHDFNNSLVPLLGYVTLIKDEIGSESDAQAYLAKLEAAFNKTGGFLDSVLLAVRPRRKFSPKPMDLAALIEDVVAEWKASLPASALIEAATDLNSCPVLIDEVQWRQTISHLLKNSHYGLAVGGRLEITLKSVCLSKDRARALKLPSGEVFQLTIEDNGFGMPEPVLRRACEPFFSTRPKGQGLGLGLTIVHSVVQLHGGQLTIESAEDCGTKVIVWIPISQRLPVYGKNETFASNTVQDFSQAKTKITLIERDPLLREVIKTYFGRYNYDVTAMENASEALNVISSEEGRVQCVITEDGNGSLSAKELAGKLAEVQPGIPLILVRNKDADVSGGEFLDRLENMSVIQRPFSLGSLKALVETQLSRS